MNEMPLFKIHIGEMAYGEAVVEAETREDAYDKICNDWDMVDWVDGEVVTVDFEEIDSV